MFTVLTNEPCEQGHECRNSPANAVPSRVKCMTCKWSPESNGDGKDHWRGVTPRVKHRQREASKRAVARGKLRERRQQRREKDPDKRKVLKQAARAEKATAEKLIKATRNSGRSLQDGDHLVVGAITLDTKNQSKREHPLVRLGELGKVRGDSANAKTLFGALLIRNKHGVGVVVFAEEDFNKLTAMLMEKES